MKKVAVSILATYGISCATWIIVYLLGRIGAMPAFVQLVFFGTLAMPWQILFACLGVEYPGMQDPWLEIIVCCITQSILLALCFFGFIRLYEAIKRRDDE